MRAPEPPRLAEALLWLFLPAGIVREDVVSSLNEEFAELARREGRASATRWYWRQMAGVVLRAGQLRGVREGVVSELGRDLKFAWRAIVRSPGPYLVAILTMALGIGVNAAMFSIVNGVVLSPLPYPEVERLVQVWPEKRWSVDLLRDVRERTESFETIAGGLATSLTLVGDGQPEVLETLAVSAGYFEMFGGAPVLGRLFTHDDDLGVNEPGIILAHDFWLRRFGGDSTVVGRALELGGLGIERRRVVGVMEPEFDGVPDSEAGWIPWLSDPEAPGYRATYGGTVVARLAPGVTQAMAIEEMRSLIPALQDAHATQFREARHSPLDVVPLLDALVRQVRTRLLLLLGAVGVVLLIACTNVANLLLARTTARRQEIGLRVALGADTPRIVRQMMTESVFLGVVGGAIGLAVSGLTLPALRGHIARYLPRAELIALDVSVVLYATVISVVAGLVFGVVPGLRLAQQGPGAALNDHNRGSASGRRGARANDALVVVEVALSLVLVVGAGLLLKSLEELGNVDLGYRAEGVLTVNFGVPAGRYDEDGARRALFRSLLDRVESVPGVSSAAVVNGRPLEGGWAGVPYVVPGQEPPSGQSIVAGFRAVSPEYFNVLEIPLVEGRMLNELDTSDSEVVALANEAFVRRHWPGESAVDRVILDPAGDEFARIVGVVGDTRFAGLDQDAVPSLYVHGDQVSWLVYSLLARTEGHPMAYLDAVTRAIHEIEPNMPLQQPRTLLEIADEARGDVRFYSRLLGGFAALALLLGLVGVYGVTAYAVGQRRREIGVRVALGASRTAVVAHTLRRGMTPILAGVLFGLIGAYWTTRLMAGVLFGVESFDVEVYAMVTVLILVSGLAAVLVPSMRVLGFDPTMVLRGE